MSRLDAGGGRGVGSGAAPQHARRRTWSPARVFVAVLVIAFLNMAAWSIATPLFASPDEPAQVARAVALVHGDLVGTTVKNAGNAITDITIPAVYSYRSGAAYGSCFVFQPDVPASCAAPITRSTAEVATTTYAGRYPPLYYAIVGLPSLFTSSPTGIYLIRLVSALLNAVFLALAALSVVAWSRSRMLLIGLLVATTPMTFFLGGVVNASGFEITSATCLWCSGVVLRVGTRRQGATRPGRGGHRVGRRAAPLPRPVAPLGRSDRLPSGPPRRMARRAVAGAHSPGAGVVGGARPVCHLRRRMDPRGARARSGGRGGQGGGP